MHGDASAAAADAEALLACPAAQRAAYIAAHSACQRLATIEALKHISDTYILSDATAAAEALKCAFLLAAALPTEPLAFPLATWAQGNWEMHHNAREAIRLYETALAAYRARDDHVSVARLLGNLVSVYGDCGEFAAAQRAYEEARALYMRLGDPALWLLHALEQNYGYLLHEQGHYEAALAVHERALRLAYQLNDPIFVTEVRINSSLTLGMLGRLEEGIAAFHQDRTVAAQHNQGITVARIDMNLGELYSALGKPAEALHALQSARAQFAALGNDLEVAQVWLQEGILFARIGALREARRSYMQARHRFEALGLRPSLGRTLVWQAIAARLSGDYCQAAHLLDTAQELWDQLDQPWWRTRVLFERAELSLAQQDDHTGMAVLHQATWIPNNPLLVAQRSILRADLQAMRWHMRGDPQQREAARQDYTAALAYAQQHGNPWMQRRAWAGLGKLALLDQPDDALHYLAHALTHDDMIRRTLSVEELKAGFQAQSNDLFPLLIRQAIDTARPLQALRFVWHAKGSALLDLLQATAADRAAAPQQADGAEALEQVRQRLASHRWDAAQAGADDMPEDWRERNDPVFHMLEQQLADLRYQRNCATTTQHDHGIDHPETLLQHLDADVLIEYVNCDGQIAAIRADGADACQAYWVADESVLLDLLDAIQLVFQNVLTRPPQQRAHDQDAWIAECLPLLQQAYELLIAPLGPLPPEARVLLAPCEPLSLFPFAALWDGQHYLMERVYLEMTPSGALLAAPPPETTPTTAPLLVAASAAGKIPEVAAEVAAIQKAFPESTCLIDDPDDLAYLANLPGPPALLHLSAHTILTNTAPIFCALHLGRSVLSVEQCYDLRLAGTRLVTLSGCTTASGMDTGGALLAFQSAFFAAGARYVISSLWSIDARSTVTWMATFYRLLASGISISAALCQTQRLLLQDAAAGHPAIWAAFIVSRR